MTEIQSHPLLTCFNHRTLFFLLLKGKAMKKKSSWQKTEVQVVERQMMKFITSLIVLGKMDCERCLRAEPEALKNRDLQTTKLYVQPHFSLQKEIAELALWLATPW